MKTPLNVLVVLLALSLVACGGKEDPQSAPAATDAAVSQGEPADAFVDEDDPPFEGEPAAPADETDFADRPGVSARDWAEAIGQSSDSTQDRGQPDSAVADPTSVSAPSAAATSGGTAVAATPAVDEKDILAEQRGQWAVTAKASSTY